MTNSDLLQSIEDLEQHYRSPRHGSRAKISHSLTAPMQQWLAHSSFLILSTCSENGLDCSPRGDKAGNAFRILDENTIAIPDRRGNNRIDTLKNLIKDPRVGVLFMVPGVDEALRIKGKATVSIASDLLDSFIVDDDPAPATVILIEISAAYVQNARAIRSSGLWNIDSHKEASELPSAAQLSDKPVPATRP